MNMDFAELLSVAMPEGLGTLSMVSLVLMVGLVSQPIFVIAMTHFRPANPMAGKGGVAWCLAAVGVLGIGVIFAMGGGVVRTAGPETAACDHASARCAVMVVNGTPRLVPVADQNTVPDSAKTVAR